MVNYMMLVKDSNVFILIKVDGWITMVTLPRLPWQCQYLYLFPENEGPQNIDIVLYLFMRIIGNINMCFVK